MYKTYFTENVHNQKSEDNYSRQQTLEMTNRLSMPQKVQNELY